MFRLRFVHSFLLENINLNYLKHVDDIFFCLLCYMLNFYFILLYFTMHIHVRRLRLRLFLMMQESESTVCSHFWKARQIFTDTHVGPGPYYINN